MKLFMDKTTLIKKYGSTLRGKSKSSVVELSKQIDIDFNFQIHKINTMVQEFNGNMPPNRFSQHVMAIITRGSGEKQIGSTKFKIAKDTIFYIPPNTIHSSSLWDLKTDGFMLTFNDTFFMEHGIPLKTDIIDMLSNRSNDSYKKITGVQSSNIVDIFRIIEVEEQSPELLYNKELIALKVAELLYNFLRIFKTTQTLNSSSIYHKFNKLVNENYQKHKSVTFYAEALAIHPNHLNRVIKKYSGECAKKLISNRIIIEAKYLLSTTTLSVKEIAEELGFTDQNTLSRYFKKNELISMKEYRQKYI